MPTKIRTLSQLPQISSNGLNDVDLFEVSVPVSAKIEIGEEDNQIIWKYASRAIKKQELTNRLIKDIKLNLSAENGFTDKFDFTSLCSTVSSIGYGDFSFIGQKNFEKNPTIDNSPLSSYDSENENLDKYSVNYETLRKFNNVNSSPAIGPKFGFVTTLSGKRADTEETERTVQLFITNENNIPTKLPSFVFDQNVKHVAQNEFIFKIPYGERESGEWIAPVTGMFTCYGWLDEINTPSQSNETRWVALMGYEEIVQKWTILQVQPFIKNNYLSYVGFTFPVKRGMHLKIMTGFAVGNNSDKYFASNSSIANHQANAFLGGIYTGLSDVISGGDMHFSNVDGKYATIDDLSAYVTHVEENACDLSTNARIDELSNYISSLLSSYTDNDGDDTSPTIIVDTSKYSKYIDAANYNLDIYADNSNIRHTIINFGSGYLSANAYGVFRTKQYGWYGRENNGNEFDALSINWADSDNGKAMIRVPKPFHVTPDSDGNLTYHGYDYTLEDIPPGAVFSDGIYFYYCVSQDSTVAIQSNEFTSNDGEWTSCRLLYGQNNAASYRNIGTLLLNTFVDGYSGIDPITTISLPLKKGNILMFAIYVREKVPHGGAYDGAHQVIPGQGDKFVTLNDLLTNKKYEETKGPVTGSYSRPFKDSTVTIYRLNADGSTVGKAFQMSSSDDSKGSAGQDKYEYDLTRFGTIISITELP